ncbi:hypothetical protein JOM56_009653 [Amanita muscaria]
MFQRAHGVNISGQPHFVNIANVNQLSNLGGSQGLENFRKSVSLNALHDSSAQELDRQVHQVLRKNTLKQLQDWADDPIVTEHIIWLHGPVSIGKTAIALEIAWTGREKVAATFFFSRTDASRNDGNRLFPTLAWQFIVSIPDIKNHIIHSINERPDLPNKGVEAQFEYLIAQPFAAMTEATSAVGLPGLVVIIDGIDECADIRLQRRILKVIGNAIQDPRVPLRFIISSRPDTHIQETFHQFQCPIFCIDLVKFGPAEEIRKREEEIGKREEEMKKREEEMKKREEEMEKRENEMKKREEEIDKREEEIKYPISPSPSPGSYPSLHELTDRSSSPFIGPFTTAPEAKTKHKYGEVYSRRKLYRCDAEDHPVSCHCDAPSGSFSPALASERSNMPIPTFISEHVGTVCQRDSASPQMTAPERQSNQESAHAPDRIRVRSLSDVFPMPTRRHQDRPDDDSQPSSESPSQSSSPEPGASLNLMRGVSPNGNVRRYNILPRSSPPESTTMPSSARRPRHNGSRSLSHSRSGSTAFLQMTPGISRLSSHECDISTNLRREESPNENVRRRCNILLSSPLTAMPNSTLQVQRSRSGSTASLQMTPGVSRSLRHERSTSTNRREESPNVANENVRNILPKSSPPESNAKLNSTLTPRHNGSRSLSRSRSGFAVSLQMTPVVSRSSRVWSGITEPLQVTPGATHPANSYQQPPRPSPKRIMSHASDAAMEIEQSQREKVLRGRENRRTRGDRREGSCCPESDRPKKQSSSTSISYTQQTSPYHSGGLPGSPHRDTYMSAQPTSASQKTSGTSASDTLGGRNSNGSVGKPLFLS